MNRGAAGIAAVLLPVVLAGCGSDDGGRRTTRPRSETPSQLPQSDEPFKLDPAELSPDVTNPWFPLEPGTRWTYREVDEDGEVLEVVVTATSETRTIANGAEARVVRDTVTLDGEIVEDTLDWYAQDALGTVWYLGEDTAEFEDGYITSHEGSFEAGVDDALAGVIMPADPDGRADATGRSTTPASPRTTARCSRWTVRRPSPPGRTTTCVQTADTNALEPDVLEHKFYARDVGVVLTDRRRERRPRGAAVRGDGVGRRGPSGRDGAQLGLAY